MSLPKKSSLEDLVAYIGSHLQTVENYNSRYLDFIEDFELLIDNYVVETEEDEIDKRVLLDVLKDMNELIETHATMIFYLKGILKISENRTDIVYDRVLNGCRMFGDLFGELITSAIKIKTRFGRLYSLHDAEVFNVETINEIEDIKEQYMVVERYLVNHTRKVYNETQLYVEKMMMIERRLGR